MRQLQNANVTGLNLPNSTQTQSSVAENDREKLRVLKSVLDGQGVDVYAAFKEAGLHTEIDFPERATTISFASDQQKQSMGGDHKSTSFAEGDDVVAAHDYNDEYDSEAFSRP